MDDGIHGRQQGASTGGDIEGEGAWDGAEGKGIGGHTMWEGAGGG